MIQGEVAVFVRSLLSTLRIDPRDTARTGYPLGTNLNGARTGILLSSIYLRTEALLTGIGLALLEERLPVGLPAVHIREAVGPRQMPRRQRLPGPPCYVWVAR